MAESEILGSYPDTQFYVLLIGFEDGVRWNLYTFKVRRCGDFIKSEMNGLLRTDTFLSLQTSGQQQTCQKRPRQWPLCLHGAFVLLKPQVTIIRTERIGGWKAGGIAGCCAVAFLLHPGLARCLSQVQSSRGGGCHRFHWHLEILEIFGGSRVTPISRHGSGSSPLVFADL